MDTITACFYKGSAWNIPDFAVRWYTRRKGQAWADVPAHCAVVLNVGGVLTLYEMISSGWHSRPATLDDLKKWAYTVPVSSAKDVGEFAWSQRSKRYGWLTIVEIILSRLVPDRWLKNSRGASQQVCSWFVKAALEAGGWPCPHWLRAQDCPPSPNDLLYAVRQTPALGGERNNP